MELIARNVHEALPFALRELVQHGMPKESRNGPVLVFPEPVMTTFLKPMERVLFYRERDANPFFHFFEALWMLAGRNDVAFPARFVERMRTFSDDGIIFNGAYGFRWREHFGVDQLTIIADTLSKNREDRRSVLGMWDASHDLGLASKDLPCNLNAKFNIRADGALHMTVDNRSNDIIWGLYGANAVHFGFLLEYMAARIGVPVGYQVHLSNDFHAYTSTLEPLRNLAGSASPYNDGRVRPYPIMTNAEWRDWDKDLALFFMATEKDGDVFPHDFLTPFFQGVVMPMWHAHLAFKTLKGPERFTQAHDLLSGCLAEDWSWAAKDWIEVRQRKAEAA